MASIITHFLCHRYFTQCFVYIVLSNFTQFCVLNADIICFLSVITQSWGD